MHLAAMHLVSTITLLMLATAVHAYPEFWAQKSVKVVGDSAGDACAVLPGKGYGGHIGVIADKESSLLLTDKDTGAQSNGKVCAGHAYHGQIHFPAASTRKAFLAASAGQLSRATGEEATSLGVCEGKWLSWNEGTFNLIPFQLSIPTTAAAGDTVSLKVASAAEAQDAFHTFTATFTVADCAVATEELMSEAGTAEKRKLLQTKVGGYTGVCAPKKTSSKGCTASKLGYSCQVDSIATGPHFTSHYALGGCPPANPCTQGAEWYIQENDIASKEILHLYGTGKVSGYISLAFAKDYKKMQDADAIFAFKDGDKVTTYVLPLKNQVANSPSDSFKVDDYLAYFGFLTDGENATICFGRVLDLTSKNIPGINVPVVDPDNLQLTWAQSDRSSISTHDPDNYGRGGFLLTGITKGAGVVKAATLKSNIDDIRAAHGALLVIAWAFLVPFGILNAKHKWYFTKPLAGKPTWFTVHRAFNALGFILTLAACIMAFVKLDIVHEPKNTGDAHRILGIIIFALSGLQFLLAWQPIRPDGKHKLRPIWNNVHWWLGRITILGALISLFLGIYQFHHVAADKKYAPYAAWLVPVCLSLGAIFGFDIYLTFAKFAKDKAEVEAAAAKTVDLPNVAKAVDSQA